MEQRTLAAAYKFLLQQAKLKNAHSAEADIIATYEVFRSAIRTLS
jgi:DNA polymerase-3 subunit epsilon